MNLREVKLHIGKNVYYDTGQMNFDGCSIRNFIFTACILRAENNGKFYYEAELSEPLNNKSTIIVPLEKVLTSKNEK